MLRSLIHPVSSGDADAVIIRFSFLFGKCRAAGCRSWTAKMQPIEQFITTIPFVL